MNARYADRLARAAREAASQGFAALVVAPSPDLAYLTGYDPMPLERPTLLVLRPDRDPTMLVPELERPLAADCPGRRRDRARGLDRRRGPVRGGVPAPPVRRTRSRWATGSGPLT